MPSPTNPSAGVVHVSVASSEPRRAPRCVRRAGFRSSRSCPRGRRTRRPRSRRSDGASAGPRVHCRVNVSGIVDRELVVEIVGVAQPVPLDQLSVSRAPWKLVLGSKLVVSTTSVSPSQRPRESPSHCVGALRQVRPAVERDDARLVDQFLKHDDVAGRLEDLVVAAVPAADAVPAARDAPRPQAEIGVAVGRSALAPFSALGREPRLRFGREWRDPAVGRIGDERRSRQRFPLVAPERVVCPWIAGARRLVEAPALGLLERLRFFFADRFTPGQRTGARSLQRRRRLAVPLALNVGIAPRRPRRATARLSKAMILRTPRCPR